MRKYLNKADFLRYKRCPTAAYYGWHNARSKLDDDPFLKFLAEEGRIVERAGRRLFANAHLVKEQSPERAFAETLRWLQEDQVTLFEACLIGDGFIARPDVLIKRGEKIFLIEIKSKVADLAAHRQGRMLINFYGNIRAEWRDYVYDLAFQCAVVARAVPTATILPFFLLPEERSTAEFTEANAVLKETEDPPSDEEEVKLRRSRSVMKFFSAREVTERIAEATRVEMNAMRTVLESGERPPSPLKYGCRNCEFRLANGTDRTDGWHQCWGSAAEPSPHLFDLHQLYSLRANGNLLLADEKIASRNTSLFDVSTSELHGKHAARQRIQLENQKSETEWLDPALRNEILRLKWPIVFLDFETAMGAIPWYQGMRPYELLPFQFSAHVLLEDGSCQHHEWLNTTDTPPQLRFIRALRMTIGDEATILTYTGYEDRVLREAKDYLKREVGGSEEEQLWITTLLLSGRLVDQHEWVLRWYFHPSMEGRTSLKKVLPAIWQSNLGLRHSPSFEQYFDLGSDGAVLDPYQTLPTARIDGVEFEVREGCAAMQVYREMIRGVGEKNSDAKSELASLLRAYVTLDTASQWILFEHWRQRLGISQVLIDATESAPWEQKNELTQRTL